MLVCNFDDDAIIVYVSEYSAHKLYLVLSIVASTPNGDIMSIDLL